MEKFTKEQLSRFSEQQLEEIEAAARWFTFQQVDTQIEFLVQVARMGNTGFPNGKLGAADHWKSLGSHAHLCHCSSFEARQLLADIMTGYLTGGAI